MNARVDKELCVKCPPRARTRCAFSMHSRNPTLIPAPVAPAVGSAAAVACILGIVIGGCSALGASSIVGWLFSGAPVTAFFPLQAYLTAVGLFHMLEFFITAHYNPSRLYDDCASLAHQRFYSRMALNISLRTRLVSPSS